MSSESPPPQKLGANSAPHILLGVRILECEFVTVSLSLSSTAFALPAASVAGKNNPPPPTSAHLHRYKIQGSHSGELRLGNHNLHCLNSSWTSLAFIFFKVSFVGLGVLKSRCPSIAEVSDRGWCSGMEGENESGIPFPLLFHAMKRNLKFEFSLVPSIGGFFFHSVWLEHHGRKRTPQLYITHAMLKRPRGCNLSFAHCFVYCTVSDFLAIALSQ